MYNKEPFLSYKDDYEKEISELYSGRTIEDEIRNIIFNYNIWQGYGSESEIDLLFFDYDKNAINPFGEKIYDKDDTKYFGEIYRSEKGKNLSNSISVTEQEYPSGKLPWYDGYLIFEIHSNDEIIWLDNKDSSDRLKLYFKYYELNDYYRKTLRGYLWSYNTNDEAWYNWNTSKNYYFAVSLINNYDLDTPKKETPQEIRYELSNENENENNSNNNNIENKDSNDYEQQIIDILTYNGKMKAIEIAKKLGLTRRDVNRILYYKLMDKCEKDEDYRWYIKYSE